MLTRRPGEILRLRLWSNSRLQYGKVRTSYRSSNLIADIRIRSVI